MATSKEHKQTRSEQLQKAGNKIIDRLNQDNETFQQLMSDVRGRWGGRRPNQTGRPHVFDGEQASENVGFKLPPSYAKLLDEKRSTGESRGQAARRLLLDILQRAEQAGAESQKEKSSSSQGQ